MSASSTFRFASALLVVSLGASVAQAEEEPERRQMTQAEIEAWLDARGMPGGKDIGSVEEPPEVPPPPPRASGIVIESTVGALGHLGPLKNVSPTSPWFNLKLGFEPLTWLMLFGQGELSVSNTSYANPPPEPRTYNMYGFGGGLRFTVRPTDRIGIYLQGEVGAAEIDEDVLFVYGYTNADQLNLYYGGELGFEWYQVNPHLGLALHGGVRNYDAGLGRDRSSQVALAWIGGASLRYAFDL
ncbi:MAG: hypothetical protein KC776_26820 [Myxococcales bacterium]|nr:hypothetical protein [Myxococcales bacterium]MCB9578935.1 hypothetical protein [Polyangiaceae bacterium]